MPQWKQTQPEPKRYIRKLREELEALHAYNIMKFGPSCPDDEAFLAEWKFARAEEAPGESLSSEPALAFRQRIRERRK